jgi:hypothetical protein
MGISPFPVTNLLQSWSIHNQTVCVCVCVCVLGRGVCIATEFYLQNMCMVLQFVSPLSDFHHPVVT